MRLRIIILSFGIALGLGAKLVGMWMESSPQPALEITAPAAEASADQVTATR